MKDSRLEQIDHINRMITLTVTTLGGFHCTWIHLVSVDVAAVDLDVVDAPFGEGLGIGLEVAEDAGVTSARVVAVVLVDAELQTEIVNLTKRTRLEEFRQSGYPHLSPRFHLQLNRVQIVSQIWTSWTRIWWFGFRLKPIFNTAPLSSKKTLALKVVKNNSKIIISLC